MNPSRHFRRTLLTGDRPFTRPLPTQDNKAQEKKHVHTSIHRTGFEVEDFCVACYVGVSFRWQVDSARLRNYEKKKEVTLILCRWRSVHSAMWDKHQAVSILCGGLAVSSVLECENKHKRGEES